MSLDMLHNMTMHVTRTIPNISHDNDTANVQFLNREAILGLDKDYSKRLLAGLTLTWGKYGRAAQSEYGFV